MNPHPHAAILRALADDMNVRIEEFDTVPVEKWYPSNIGRVLSLPHRKFRLAPKEPQVDPDGWIEWHGGKCPVPEGAFIDYILRNGTERTFKEANRLCWSHSEYYPDFDIIRYRIHKPEKAKRYEYLWRYKDFAGHRVMLFKFFPEDVKPTVLECEMERIEWSKTEVPE